MSYNSPTHWTASTESVAQRSEQRVSHVHPEQDSHDKNGAEIVKWVENENNLFAPKLSMRDNVLQVFVPKYTLIFHLDFHSLEQIPRKFDSNPVQDCFKGTKSILFFKNFDGQYQRSCTYFGKSSNNLQYFKWSISLFAKRTMEWVSSKTRLQMEKNWTCRPIFESKSEIGNMFLFINSYLSISSVENNPL